MMNIVDDIKTVLEFYQALGFERLPIKTAGSSEQLAVKSQQTDPNFTKGGQGGINGSSRITHYASRDKKAALNALHREIGDCKRCKLSKGRKNLVLGEGNPGASLMFIGEAPGREEDIQGRPFVGDAGKLLTRLIERMGFKREDVYIGNIVKCRPPMNRDPEEGEIRTCLPFIERQIEIISPKVIVALGRISAQTLIGAEVPITKLRGRFYEYKGVPIMPTFHPAYLLRNPKSKWLVWEDAQKVIEELKKKGGSWGE